MKEPQSGLRSRRRPRACLTGATLLLAVATALTLLLAARTFWYLFHSVTNVPYPDQWVMLEEIRALRAGQSGWSYLWRPYWGHRIVLPRLWMLLSANYFQYPMLPFVVANVAAQLSMLLAMVLSIRRLFAHRSLLFWLAAIAAAHLLLSSLQMEILVEGQGIVYTVGYASAVAAIVILGAEFDPWLKLEARLAIAVLLAIISTAVAATGLFVWPILIFEAWLVGVQPKRLALLTALTAVIVAAYMIGYNRPEMGMGIMGAIRHPIQAVAVAAFVLGGPISLYAPWLGVAVGAIGMAAAGGITVYFWRTRSTTPAAVTLTIVVLLLLGSAASIAAGRITPEALAGHTGQPVSRYMAPTFVFWAALFPVSLTLWKNGRMGRLAAMAVSAVILILTFGTWNLQWRMSRAWAQVSQSYDAIASGFLAGVSDQEYMSPIIRDEQYRSRMVDYMREQHLSVFAEPRARWMDRSIGSIAPIEEGTRCRATTKPVRLGGDSAAFRVTGTLTVDGRAPRSHLDILMTDDAGMVNGLARTLPAQSEGSGAEEFFGYSRTISSQGLRLFVLDRDRLLACPP